ncbi:unnamed protein product [Durusdinium trenchii]|uniref:Uncharacterized protein n=1 Tax=Durusdinium trenchii TaxID=1381693 RepID=A0ABP0N7X5_9DINO
MATPVIQEEAKEQESVFAKKKQSEISNMAKEFLNKSCFMVHWGHKLVWNAGLDATKDLPAKMSSYRMKASADEDRMQNADITTRLTGEPDAAPAQERGVVGSDKGTPGLKRLSKRCGVGGAADDDEDDGEMALADDENEDGAHRRYAKCTALKLQLGMQFSKKLGVEGWTKGGDAGLHQLMLDVVLALKRSETTWRYADCVQLLFDAEDEGRAAAGKLQRWGLEEKEKRMTEYVVVTLMISCYGAILEEKEDKIRSAADVKKILGAISEVQEDELLQLDVQWIPEEAFFSVGRGGCFWPLKPEATTVARPSLSVDPFFGRPDEHGLSECCPVLRHVIVAADQSEYWKDWPTSGKFASDSLLLSSSATALLFKLSQKTNEEEFLNILHSFCGPMWQMQVAERKPYDFVHLPWSKLAVVNFTSPEACVVCFDMMKMVAGMPGVNITDVCEALHHGLAANLAHFITKSQQASKISMPLVFISGHRVPPLLACRLVS